MPRALPQKALSRASKPLTAHGGGDLELGGTRGEALGYRQSGGTTLKILIFTRMRI